VTSVRVFFLLPVKWPISERSEKGGQVKSWRLILNSVFCFLTSALAVRIEFEGEFEFEFEGKRERGTGQISRKNERGTGQISKVLLIEGTPKRYR